MLLKSFGLPFICVNCETWNCN